MRSIRLRAGGTGHRRIRLRANPPVRRGAGAAALRVLAAALACLLLAGCEDLLVPDRGLEIEATGVVRGAAFLDANGTGDADGGDRPAEGLRVVLEPAAGGPAAAEATTDSLGGFAMEDVPVGTFRLALDPATLGDSVEVAGLDDGTFDLADADTASFGFHVAYPTVTLAGARELERGTKVFTHGVALNPRDRFGDGAVHLREGDVHLRATGVPRTTLFPGDSVRFLGTTGTEAGRPVLTHVTPFVLRDRVVSPQPEHVSTAEAATADDARLDAGLVVVRDAGIVDTATVDDDFVATVDDGSGPVDVVLREFIGFDTDPIRPDSAVVREAEGLLVPGRTPEGAVRWSVHPRFPSDLDVEQNDDSGGDGG